MTYRAADLDAAAMYDLMVASIVPRPIAFVSTISPDGVPNLAPFSFFTAGGANPPSLVFSVTLNARGEPKDTLRNILHAGEFVVNTVSRSMTDGMNMASLALPRTESEWPLTNFESLPSELIAPKRVAQSPAAFECRLAQVAEHGIGPGAARYVIGEILVIHLQADLPHRTVARLGGPDYLDLDALAVFSLDRPQMPSKGLN